MYRRSPASRKCYLRNYTAILALQRCVGRKRWQSGVEIVRDDFPHTRILYACKIRLKPRADDVTKHVDAWLLTKPHRRKRLLPSAQYPDSYSCCIEVVCF